MQAQRPGDILLVDGNEAFRAGCRRALEGRGHSVVTCANAQEARWHLERTVFDVALCAQALPDESGRALCHFIKTSPDLYRVSVGLFIDPSMGVAEFLAPTNDRSLAGGTQHSLELPDDLLPRSMSTQELLLRVQGLLRLRRYQEEIHNAITALMSMAEGIEEQDRRARGHCNRLSIMAVELGAVLGCDEWQLTALERAGYLHDVGKVSIPGALLEKIQPLSPREMELIKDHCTLGEKLCTGVQALRPVLPIIRHHHERADGTGYPDGLRGDAIPVLAQIFSVVDVYDSLRTWRPYRAPMIEAQAIDVMRQEVARGYWNRHVFEAFLKSVLPGLNERLDTVHVLWP